MALTDYKKAFDNAYQEVLSKVLVGKAIANMRFENTLKFGASVERIALDFSGVRIRDTVRGNASTVDSINDTSELLTINIEKEAVFHISDGEITQTGELNAMEKCGAEIAKKVATDLDARVLYETVNAANTFDTGDLTTLSSTGVSFAVDTTNTPIMAARMSAKLRRANKGATPSRLAFVIDSYGLSGVEQYLLGKQFDIVNSVFKNGYTGALSQAEVYVSENLTGEAVITDSGTFSDGEIFVINGITFTMKTALSSGPAIVGEIVIGNNLAASMTNIAAALNAPSTTTATYTALAAADYNAFFDLNVTATATATTVTIVGKGSGRFIVSTTGGSTSWSKNLLHCYFGAKGAIDLVVQAENPVDVRPTSDRRGNNIFSSYLAGLKTFADGSKKFLNVLITA